MKKFVVFAIVGLFLFVGLAFAQTKATKESCQTLVKKAVAYYKEVGREKALVAFNDSKGKFVDGENYLSIYDLKGVVVGHGANNSLIGKSMIAVKDPKGKLLIQAFIDAAKKPGDSGWVDYNWTNPVSKKIEPKESYFVRVDDLIIQAGYYK
jgi:cytochrome c